MPLHLHRISLAAIAICSIWLAASSIGRGDNSRPEGTPPEIQNPDYDLTIALAKSAITVGEPMLLTFTLRNTGIRETRVIQSHPLRIYQIEIVNLDNKQPVRLTERGEQIFKICQEGSVAVRKLKPGEGVESKLENLTEIYDLSHPGEYSLSAHRRVHSQTGPRYTTIRAPLIKFAVEPSP